MFPNIRRARRPIVPASERVVLPCDLPRLHRSPDRPGFHPVLQELLEDILARILVRRRLHAESRAQDGAPAQLRARVPLFHQLAHRLILQGFPPERLAGAAHARDDEHVRVQRLQVGLREIDVPEVRRFITMAGSVRQLRQRVTHPLHVAVHDSIPRLTRMSSSNRCKKPLYA